MFFIQELIQKLADEHILTQEEFVRLLSEMTDSDRKYLFDLSKETAQSYYKNAVYTRGLIEFSNYCKNDCYYCGIRKSNKNVSRYHLTREDILSCCESGYDLGFRTFVLQGGEDLSYSTKDFVDIIKSIREGFPDCAITLSMGERPYDDYKAFFDAGANRYLLRHETADDAHYGRLHPEEMTLKNRMDCLWQLKEIGYQVGTGFMVGSPYQTLETIAKDLLFIHELDPQMIGIGPFIPHHDTPFKDFAPGTMEMTLRLIAILRLMVPNALIPATTSLGTIHPQGREQGILAGANVVMPNLSPISVRKKYMLYDNKICTGEEAAECRFCLNNRMKSIGYEIVSDRGDCQIRRK